jgi:hypothetical protein
MNTKTRINKEFEQLLYDTENNNITNVKIALSNHILNNLYEEQFNKLYKIIEYPSRSAQLIRNRINRNKLFIESIQKNNISKIKRLLRNKNVDILYINFEDEDGIPREAFEYATDTLNENINIKIIKVLINNEQKIAMNTLSSTLIDSCLKCDLDLVELLIENGADVNYDDHYEFTPLIAAIETKNIELIRLLLSNGANPNQVFTYPNGDTITPNEIAVNQFIFLDELN